MKDDLIVATDIVVPSPSMQQSSQDTPTEFMSNRFYALSKTNNTAIISGSSLAKQNHHIEQEQVLDAAATTYMANAQSVVMGVKQATADGLGGSAVDPLENQSIAKIADYACQTFINNDRPTAELLKHIATCSLDQALFEHPTKKYESTCAMASASFRYKGKGSYEGELSNMGDTLLVILSSDLKVKKMLPARQVYRGYNTWSPESVQNLAMDPDSKDNLICQSCTASEGDLIISMTDGAWSELATSKTEVAKHSRDTVLDIERFESLLQDAKLKQHFPVLECALTLLREGISQTLAHRNILCSLVAELQSTVFPADVKTVEHVLAFLKNNDKINTADTLERLLFDGSGGDGVVYIRGVKIPFSFVMQDLCQRTSGDCTTISVTRLPWHLDELIRAYMLNPQQRSDLSKALKNNLPSVSAIEQSILRLKQEQIPSQPMVLLGNLKLEKLFDDADLDHVEALLIHLFQLKQLIGLHKDYKVRLESITVYIDNQVPKLMQAELYNLVRKELAPGTGIFSFFNFEDKARYRDLSRKHTPCPESQASSSSCSSS